MPNMHELETQLHWCREWHSLRLWQHLGSPESATAFERFQIAQVLLADSNGRNKELAMAGRGKLVDHLVEKFDHADPLIRQGAAKDLADCCPGDHAAVNVLIERLRSTDQSFLDRACAIWALEQICARASEVVPILLAVIAETKDQVEAHELRRRAAYAAEKLSGRGEGVYCN